MPFTRPATQHFRKLRRQFSSTTAPRSSKPTLLDRPYRFAICGGGPAGFYSAARLLSLDGSSKIRVDLLEALPTPFGLSRYGVAPDHPEVKVQPHTFFETTSTPKSYLTHSYRLFCFVWYCFLRSFSELRTQV